MNNDELNLKFTAIENEQENDPGIDRTVLKLNIRIQQAIASYFEDKPVKFRFDLPKKKPTQATVSIFLYEIQEDVQLRNGVSRQYDVRSNTLQPGWVHLRCNYLITYWQELEKDDVYVRMPPDGEQIKAMNRVLNALLNTHAFDGLPSVYTRVIEPSEGLTSLGNFWRSLDDKPRLCIHYAVTVPMQLTPSADADTIKPINVVESVLTPISRNGKEETMP